MTAPLSESTKQLLGELSAKSPKKIDLTRADHADLVYEITASLIANVTDPSELAEIESFLVAQEEQGTIALRLALMLAMSKLWVGTISEPLRLSVVFALYKEHNRIRTQAEHLHGEDFLRKKVAQLDWLFEATPKVSWELIIVDDGCPENSGGIAREIIEENHLEEKARVLFLSEAIAQGLDPVKSLDDTGQSQKGGSIVYGMWDAVQRSKEGSHIVVYTDADLSTHLGQVGMLIKPILESGKKVAIGSRREPKSVVIKKAGRNNRGKLFIYLWKQMIPVLGSIIDTQCGFKAFDTKVVAKIIPDMIETKFAFDIELLLRAAMIDENSIEKVAIAWIDSEAASTTTDIQPYLPMLKSIGKMYARYMQPSARSDEFAAFVEDLSDAGFSELLEQIPQEIVQREPVEFNEYKGINASDLYQA
ncbi:MAG: hypothetical protein OER83_08260 [Flavobacteriaceae bacterium]|nr:hypothetical protein [Flavobacteriaceae bacterium]